MERASAPQPPPCDRPYHEYLVRRGLADAELLGLAGLLNESEGLPPAIEWWPRYGYRWIAPLFDARGELTTLQARRLTNREPRVVFPSGSHPKGCVFANAAGLALLRDHGADVDRVVLGEGLTDYWALSIACDGAVLSAPGTGFVESAIGEWVRGRDLVLALDDDDAARRVLDAVQSRALEQGVRSVRVIKWPASCKDACDVLAHHGAGEVRRRADARKAALS